MHGALLEHTPVLSLAPDSIASLGELDATSLSDLWGVFTKCKDSLQNGRRLENLSWRLWFDSGGRDARSYLDGVAATEGKVASSPVEDEWSDPEWTESTSDSDSDDAEPATRPGRPDVRRAESPAATVVVQEADPAPSRPPLAKRCTSGGPFERRSTSTITGGSLQRMITGLTTLPAITAPIKARSVIDVPLSTHGSGPSLPPRGASAPDVLESAPSSPPDAPLHTPALQDRRIAPRVDAPTQTTPKSTATTTPVRSPVLGRSHAATASATAVPPRASSSRSLARSSSAKKPAAPLPKSAVTASQPVAEPSHQAAARVLSPAFAPLRTGSHAQLARNASSASMEPRSYVKGFDTTLADSLPLRGSIAPPPTPAPAPPVKLGSPPPSAMKSAAKPTTTKKIFFISSPNSDSDDDASPPTHRGHHHHHHHSAASTSKRVSPKAPASSPVVASVSSHATVQPAPSRLPPAGRPPPNTEQDEGDWDDDDDDDDDGSSDSSGWGSEYSTESEAEGGGGRGSKPDRSQALFAKRPSMTGSSELKPRGPGLLSQLFHPGMMVDNDRRHSTVDVTAASKKARPTLPTSRSAGLLTEKLRNKSFLRGAPSGVEMESSSDEDEDEGDGFVDEDSSPDSRKGAQGNAIAAALVRHERQLAEAAIAPPQSPRTTRRAMLATELSESLRRNLLWERQTRNRILGGPINARFQPAHAPAQPAQTSQTQGAVRAAAPQPSFEGLRAPHPSPATRTSSPVEPMVRRHTTGTGLYLAAQKGILTISHGTASSESESSDEEREVEADAAHPRDVYREAFDHGLHDHGW